MNKEFRLVELQDLAISITDCHHSTPRYTESGKLVVRNYNIKKGRFLFENLSYTDQEQFEHRIARAKPEPGDLIITREAPMGEVCIIPDDLDCCLGQRMVLIKPDPEKVDNKFLLYSLLSNYCQTQINKSEGTGSIVSNLRMPVLKELHIPYLPLYNQQKITSILSAIDDKIELNNKINAELEGMAKLIYDYWFVQFDFPYDFRQGKPADETSNPKDVKPYKSSGGKMVWNKELKREVPEGWGSGTLKDVIELLYGKPLKSEGRTGKGFPVVGSGGIVGYHEESLVKGPGIVVGRKGTVGNITFLHEDFYPIDTSYYVKPKNDHQIYYFYFLLRSLGMEKMNSDSAVPGLNRERALGTKITQCDNKLIYSFNRAIEPTFSKIKVIQKQNQELSAIRDWLLPMLMNGQVGMD